MKFLFLAAVPLAIAGAGSAHAQSVSRAIPPDAVVTSTAVHAALAPAKLSPSVRAVQAKTVSEPVAAVTGLRASAALPPEAAAKPAVQIASREPKAEVVDETPGRIEDDDTERQPARRSARSDMDGDVRCVAQAVYHEARGESVQGQRAVADVVMNRARSGKWGNDACAVVNAPKQFSNRWTWRAPQIGVAAWDRAVEIARDAVGGVVSVSSRLMNFRAASMGSGGLRSLRIGNHIFW